jgi:hypothetical protein
MAVYGEALLAFPEQFRDYLYFDADPKIGDGYEGRENVKSATGVVQTATSRAKDSNGNLVISRNYKLWTATKLGAGKFVEFEGLIYRVMTDADWPNEGGFYDFDIEKVVGSTIRKTPETADEWNTGEGHFG